MNVFQLVTRQLYFGIDAMQLRTDQPYGTTLGKFFEKREQRRARG